MHTHLAGRYTEAVDAIGNSLIPSIMETAESPNKEDRSTTDALVWRIDGEVTDGFDFFTRVALRVRAATKKAKQKDIPADALIPRHYEPSKQWSERARQVGEHGLYLVAIEVRKRIEPHLMDTEQRIGDEPTWAYFTHNLSIGVTEQYKLNPAGDEPITLTQLTPFQAVLDAACNTFVASHAEATLQERDKATFAAATEADRQGQASVGSPAQYREATAGIPDAATRIKQLARTLYSAGSDSMNPALLLKLLDPGITQTVTCAQADSNSYFGETSRQPNRPGLSHRLQWISGHANEFQGAMLARMTPDGEGFRQALTHQLQPVRQTVHLAESLRGFLEPDKTIALDPKVWTIRAR